jgi:hypothetical protein
LAANQRERKSMRPRTLLDSALVAGLALIAAGCNDTSPAAAPDFVATQGATQPTGPKIRRNAQADATTTPAKGRDVEFKNDVYDFSYSYPAKAAAIPELKALLDKRLDAARAEVEKGAKADQAEAKQNGYPYRAHSSGATWLVVTDVPRWLSLSAEMYDYSGGAHGMTFFDALLWDKQQNLARTASDLFISKAALGSVLREPFCAALDKERAKRRGEPVNRNSGDQFDECIDPVEHTIILGSSNGRTFDRIGVLVEPYAAGAYAEGTFEITLPVTQGILGSVKPAYKAEFSVK